MIEQTEEKIEILGKRCPKCGFPKSKIYRDSLFRDPIYAICLNCKYQWEPEEFYKKVKRFSRR